VLRPNVLGLVYLLAFQVPLPAAPPGAAQLPGSAKLHISIADVPRLQKAWQRTKVAQLFDDPKLKPFLDDLANESTLAKFGLTWQDLASIAKGEMSFSAIPVAPDQLGHIMTLNTNNEIMPVLKVLAKVVVSLEKHGYKVATKTIGGFPVTTYVRGGQDKKGRGQTLYSFTKDELLVAADNEKAVEEILRRWQGTSPDRLDQKKAYQEVQARAKARLKTGADFFWFAEPIGLAERERSTARIAPRRGADTLKILKDEGFTALQAMGGYVFVGQGEHDFLHYTAVYAPGPYQKSMRMLKTLSGGDFAPADWVPGGLARFETVYLDTINAFNNFGSFFDAVYAEGDAGTFDDILRGLRDDPNGPQIDLGKEVFGRLGRRITLVVGTEKPLGPYSVRSLVAVDTKDEKGLAQAVRRLMENDEDVKQHKIGGTVLWEMITREKKKKGSKPAPAKAKAPNSGVAVARGHLFLANDVKYLEKILTSKDRGLAAQADYQRVAGALDKLGAGMDCFRSFSRPDEDLQTVYELLRTNQLDKGSSLYARLLLDLFGDNVKQIDGSTFPDYQDFRRYLGPTGTYGINQADGWLLVGCALRRQ
jgi:hypothetical protein